MCIPTFVDFFLFHLFFFFVSFVFFFLLFFSRCSQGPDCIFFSFFFVRSLPDSFIPRFIHIFFHQVFFSSWSTAPLWNVTPSPPPHYLCLLTIPLLTPAGDQLVAEGVTHISLPTQEYDRGRQEKIERQTNKQSLGLTKSRGRYATLHACAFLIADMD